MLFVVIFTAISSVLASIDSIPISAKLEHLGVRGGTIIQRDRARIRAMFTKHEKRAKSVDLKSAGTHYTVKVGFGTPPTYRELMVDTGGSFTWIGPRKEYIETSTSVKQGNQLFRVRDAVTLSPSLKVLGMAFGVAAPAGGVEMEMDGILGLRRALGGNAVRLDNGSPAPNIVDALFEQGQIQKNMFGVSLAPITSQGVINGRLTFGETSLQRYEGRLNWVDITSGSLKDYWAFEQTIMYGGQVIQPYSAGIVDTGTTLLHISRQAFDKYVESIPGSQTDASTELLEIPESSIIHMRSLSFVINGKPYKLTPQAQLWPRELNHLIGGKENIYYSVINWLNDDSATVGLNFVCGYAFLQRVYTAHDASNSKIGFAETSST